MNFQDCIPFFSVRIVCKQLANTLSREWRVIMHQLRHGLKHPDNANCYIYSEMAGEVPENNVRLIAMSSAEMDSTN